MINTDAEKKERSRIRDLARRECACCIDGGCYNEALLALHGAEEGAPCCPCNDRYPVLHDGGGIDCDYFYLSVLPLNPELNELVNTSEAENEDANEERKPETKLRQCRTCGKDFMPHSNRQIYCLECGQERKRQRNNNKQRRHYWVQKSNPLGL